MRTKDCLRQPPKSLDYDASDAYAIYVILLNFYTRLRVTSQG